MPLPEAQPSDAVAEAQRMFRAVLAPWVSDLLELRRRGLDRPGFRRAHHPTLRPVATSAASSAAGGPRSAGAPLARLGVADPDRRAA
jgi:hypothetical protein